MRSFLLSFALQVTSMPVLGAGGAVPVPWIYGLHETPPASPAYAPQLQLNCRITMQAETSIRGESIYLEDLASCEGPQQLCREVLAVALAPSPKPGSGLKFPVTSVMQTLREEFPHHTFEFDGATQTNLKATAQPIDAKRLREALEERLSRQSGPLRVSLQSLRVPYSQKLRHEHYEYDFPEWDSELQRIAQFPRKTFVSLKTVARDAVTGAKAPIEWVTQVAVRVEIQALVTRKNLSRAVPLEESDVVLRWLPYQENLVKDLKELHGKSLRVALREGQPLRNFDLYQEPDVRRGERVEATVLSGGVKMNSAGQAMETGTVGQKVRIQLDSTRRQVMGLIVARSQVEVHMP
jgi:flagella basal body P-ring formation protein FlgA